MIVAKVYFLFLYGYLQICSKSQSNFLSKIMLSCQSSSFKHHKLSRLYILVNFQNKLSNLVQNLVLNFSSTKATDLQLLAGMLIRTACQSTDLQKFFVVNNLLLNSNIVSLSTFQTSLIKITPKSKLTNRIFVRIYI
jgi:hypothetical protein